MNDTDGSEPIAAQPLSNAEVDRALNQMQGWKREDGGLRKRYRCASFRDAITFVGHVAEIAEEMQHHPDIDIRWRNVIVFVTTHEVGGITNLDLTLAQRLDTAATHANRLRNSSTR